MQLEWQFRPPMRVYCGGYPRSNRLHVGAPHGRPDKKPRHLGAPPETSALAADPPLKAPREPLTAILGCRDGAAATSPQDEVRFFLNGGFISLRALPRVLFFHSPSLYDLCPAQLMLAIVSQC